MKASVLSQEHASEKCYVQATGRNAGHYAGSKLYLDDGFNKEVVCIYPGKGGYVNYRVIGMDGLRVNGVQGTLFEQSGINNQEMLRLLLEVPENDKTSLMCFDTDDVDTVDDVKSIIHTYIHPLAEATAPQPEEEEEIASLTPEDMEILGIS